MENETKIVRFTKAGEIYLGEDVGLRTLKDLIRWVSDEELSDLVGELEKAIREERLYGRCPNSRNQINRLIFAISAVLRRLSGNDTVSFLDLCMGAQPVIQ